MREIIFRGKRLDNGEWAEGYFVNLWMINYQKHQPIITDNNAVSYDVDPSTIGQYTGLIDKNGERVWEGDILHIARIADGLGGYYQPPLDYPVNVVVKWDLCAWMWETLCEDKRYISFPNAWSHYECEIIGNVHDNPELLKEEDET